MAKWKQDHIVQKLTFEIEINEKSKFHPLADRLGTIVRSSLTQKIEEALDEVNQSGRVIQINKLEIDLGNVAEKDLEKVLKEQMIEALKKELKKYISKARPYQPPSSTTTITAAEMADSILQKQQISNVALEDLLRQQQEEAQQSRPTDQQTPTTPNVAKADLSKQPLLEEETPEQKAKKTAEPSPTQTPTNAAKIDTWQTQPAQKEATDSITIPTVAGEQQSNAAREDELRQQKVEEIERTKATTPTGQATDQTTTKTTDTPQPQIGDEKTSDESTSTQQSTGINAAQDDLLTRKAVEQAALPPTTSPDNQPTELLEEEKKKQAAQALETEQQEKTDSRDDTTTTPANTAKDDLLRPQQGEQMAHSQQEEQERKDKDEEVVPETSDTDIKPSTTEASPSIKHTRRRIPDISDMGSVPTPKETSPEEAPPAPKRRKPFRRGPYYLDTAYEKAQNPFSGKKQPFKGADPANMDIPVYRADYSHQVDGILYFLRRGRLPDWFSLGEATLDDLMLDLLEEHPQIIRPRLKDLVETDVILDRLTEQFLPETLAKIQEVAELEIDEDAMNPLFDLREKASVSPFVQATIEEDYLYALFVNGAVPWWIENVESDSLEAIIRSGTGYNFFKKLLTQAHSVQQSKQILRNILKYLTEVDIQNLFSDYRKNEYGEATLLFIILDIATVEGLHFKDTLIEVLKALDGIGETVIVPRQKEATEIASKEEPPTTAEPNKDLYTLFAEGLKAPWLQYLSAEQLDKMVTTTANLSIFSQLLTEDKSTDAFKNILQRMLEQLNDATIEAIFKTYKKDNYGRDTLLYKILDTTTFEQGTFKNTLTSFIGILQAGRLPESLVPPTSTHPNKDLYTLFVEGKKEPWLQYLSAERLDIMMTTVPNLNIFSDILTESRSIESFKNILQYILEHLGDAAIEAIFKTYKKENYERDTLLYKILDTTAFEQGSFKNTLTTFIDTLQAGRLPESISRTTKNIEPPTDDNKIKDDLYDLFVNGTASSWFDNIDNKKRETILLSATNLALLRTLLTQPRTILSLKNLLQNLLQYIPESILQRIFQRYTTQDLGEDSLLYNILNTVANRPNALKATLTDFVSILNRGKRPELSQEATIELEPSTADEIVADLHALLMDGVKAAWIEQISPKRWETILLSPVSLRFFRDILSLPKPTNTFITILENVVRHLSQSNIQKILQSYRRFDFAENIVIFRILNLVETKRLNYRQAIIELTKTLKEEKEKEDLNTEVENTEPPAVYAMRDDLNELFINGNKAAWIENVSAQKWEQMLSSAIGLKYFKSILTKPRTIRSLKQVLQNMLLYLPDSLVQKIFSTYTKEDLEQATLLFKILDVNEWRKTSFKATINEFIDILDTGKLPTSPSQDPDSFASSEGVEKKKLSLEEKLQEDLNKYKTMAEQDETSTTELDIIEIIDYFLKTASLPVQSKAYDLITFERELQQAIQEQPKQVVDKIKMVTRDAILQNKALGLLTKETYELLIKKLQPVRASSLLRYFEVVHTLSSRIIQEGLPNLHVILYASKVKAEDIKAAHYIQDFVKLVVRENLANPITVIENIQQALRDTTADSNLARDLIGHLEVLKNKTRVSKRLKHQEARKPTEKTSVPYPFKDGALNQSIYIRNAGMVLLWPFLGHYFGRLKMLTPSNTFKTPEMAVRAVHLLQFLTTKHPGSAEHELMLNKILCGIPIETPIPYGISLTEEERQLSESLLRAIIKQWKALGNSSIDGLRGGFLIRDGRLQKSKSDKWTLRIEKKPYDILLGKLPWGYSMVKISWMPNILTVEWG